MREAYRIALQTACIAIASRIIGSGFRIAETFNPALKKAGLVMKPDVVIKREAITMSLSWSFSFLTNVAISPWLRQHGVSRPMITLLTSMIGTATAEAIARTIAYRKLKDELSHSCHGAHAAAGETIGKPVATAPPLVQIVPQSTSRPRPVATTPSYGYRTPVPQWGYSPMRPPIAIMPR